MSQIDLFSKVKPLFSGLDINDKYSLYEFNFNSGVLCSISFENDSTNSTFAVDKFIANFKESLAGTYVKKIDEGWKEFCSCGTGKVFDFGPLRTKKKGKDGKYFWVTVRAMKFVDDNNSVMAYFLVCDYTTQAQNQILQNRIKKRDDFYEKLLGISKLFSCSQIFKINTDDDYSVVQLSLENGVLTESPLQENWPDYCKKISKDVYADDIDVFFSGTDVTHFQMNDEGKKSEFTYRTKQFNTDDSYSLVESSMTYEGTVAIFTTSINDVSSIHVNNLSETDAPVYMDPYKRAIVTDANIFFEFNVTKNQIIGEPIQRVNNSIVKLIDSFGLSENCKYTEFVDNLCWDMSGKEKKTFRSNMDILYLTDSYISGRYELWFDFQRVNFSGDTFWSRNTVILTKDEKSGDIIGLSVVKDITQNYAGKQEMLYQLDVINALSNDYSNVYMVNLFSSHIRVIRVNDKIGSFYAEDFGDQRYEDAMDFYISVSVYEGDRDMMRMAFSRENILHQLSSKESFYVNYRSYINNKLSYMKLKVVRMGESKDYSNFLLGFMNVDDDIEHEMKQRKMLQDALSMAENANRAKTLFLSNMSHDIRTPMNAIVGFTTLAESSVFNPEQTQNYLAKIKSSSNHLLGLINDVLDMSRIESGKITLQLQPTSIEKIITDVENVMQSQMQIKNLKFTIKRHGNLTKQILCDNLRLNQILINIIGNSVKYTKDGGFIDFTVSETPQVAEGFTSYQFRIKDNGIGMTKKFKERLFQPFERDENSFKSQIQGTGLGLAITKNLVDIMQGSIFVNSEEGHGTEFLICLDFENTNSREDPVITQSSHDFSKEKFKGVKILLVEDNELNRDIARELLKQVGIEVEEAENGSIGIEKLKSHSGDYYSVVLMDVQMPVMNGIEATKIIRELPDAKKANIPIVAMTANAFDEDKRVALDAGMDSFVPKPFEISDLLNVLSQMIDKRNSI